MTSSAGSPLAARTAATLFTLIASVVCLFAARAVIAQVLGPVGIGLYALMLTGILSEVLRPLQRTVLDWLL